ncbi:unnamed protein product, partial [Ascophyllum nodosum]
WVERGDLKIVAKPEEDWKQVDEWNHLSQHDNFLLVEENHNTSTTNNSTEKNREANREAELLRAEDEEAEEGRDPVERDEMARQDSKKPRAVVKEKKMLKKPKEVERDNMCEAMRLMSEVHNSSIAAAMAETRSYGKQKEEWERNMMELEATESAPPSFKSRGSREHTSDSHWGT